MFCNQNGEDKDKSEDDDNDDDGYDYYDNDDDKNCTVADDDNEDNYDDDKDDIKPKLNKRKTERSKHYMIANVIRLNIMTVNLNCEF